MGTGNGTMVPVGVRCIIQAVTLMDAKDREEMEEREREEMMEEEEDNA